MRFPSIGSILSVIICFLFSISYFTGFASPSDFRMVLAFDHRVECSFWFSPVFHVLFRFCEWLAVGSFFDSGSHARTLSPISVVLSIRTLTLQRMAKNPIPTNVQQRRIFNRCSLTCVLDPDYHI
jgi:hypothetical protein